jgi:transcriptional regulator with XRE-family HTH domain
MLTGEMMAPSSPTVARWELALRIRNRRLELGIDVRTITEKLKFSRNYWSTVENDKAVLSETKMMDLLELFQFSAEERRELLALRDATKRRAWWTRQPGLDENVARLYGLEFGAEQVRTYEELIVTGLLQTEEYARTLVKADPSVSSVAVEQRVEIRLRRQERLTSGDPLRLNAVMSEAALMQQIGGPGVLRPQLLHLASMVENNPQSIEVRIIPFTATPGGVIGSSTIYLLDFASRHLPTVVWREAMAAHGIIEDPALVRHLAMAFDQALESCLSREKSLDLIRRSAEALD